MKISDGNLSLSKGDTTTYTLVLDARPSGDVTVTPASDDTAAARVAPARLTFTISNWDTAQTVTVTGVEDDDATNEDVTISHSIGGGGYSTVTVRSVTVTVNDDDTAANDDIPLISVSGGDAVIEDGIIVFTISAHKLVTKDVDVYYAVTTRLFTDYLTPEAQQRTGPGFLTIKAGENSVTLSLPTVNDITNEQDSVYILQIGEPHGREYRIDRSNATARVAVRSDDLPVVTITPVTSPVAPGAMAEFTVRRANPDPKAAPMTFDALTVQLSISDITAQGRNLINLTSQSSQQNIIIPPQEETVIYAVATPDDVTDKPNWAVTVALRADHTYDIGEPSSATVAIAAVRDSLPVPWLIRFGRSVSQQVVDALQERFGTPVPPGLEITLAGEELTRARLQENQQVLSSLLGFETVTAQQLVVVVHSRVTLADGYGERDAAQQKVAALSGEHPGTIGADKGYETKGFVRFTGWRGVTSHVARNTNCVGGSAIDRRSRRHPGYRQSLNGRRGIEKGCGWIKETAGLQQCKHRARGKGGRCLLPPRDDLR